MSAGRSAVVKRVHQASLPPLHTFHHLNGSRIPLTALLGLAAILLLSRGPGIQENLGAVALLKCGLLSGDPAQVSSCPALARWSAFAPPLLHGVQMMSSVEATGFVAPVRSGDDRTALSLFEQALAADPSDPLALFWRASAAYRTGDPAGAIRSWKALGQRKMAAFFTARSKGALASSDVASALEQALIAVQIDPRCGEAVHQLGQVYLQGGDLEEAESAFRKALRLELNAQDRGAAYHALGEIDRSSGRDEQALGEYRLAVQVVPGSYLFLRDLADQYARLRHYPEAQALLTGLLAGSPTDTSLQVRMGNLALDQNRYAEAERWYRSAVSAEPGSGAGEAALGRLYRQKGDLDRAEAFFRKSIQLNPDNHWVSASLGGVYWQQGRLDPAIAAYVWVTERSEDHLLLEDAWHSLAQLYATTGRVNESRSAWESVLRINPANPGAQEALHDNP